MMHLLSLSDLGNATNYFPIKQSQLYTNYAQQVSPFLPGDYHDSCLPVSAFDWTVANGSNRALRVTIALSFRDGWGGKEAKRLKSWTQQAGGGDGDERAEDGVAARLIHQVRRHHHACHV